jgi:hypothetical protein
MAKIDLPAAVTLDQLRAALTRACPDLDQQRLGPGLTASSSRWVAAWVMTQRKQIQITPMVRSMPMMLLLLLICATGLGLLIYAVAVIPKQQAVVKRVHAALARELTAVSG